MSKRPVWVSDDEALVLLRFVSDLADSNLSVYELDILRAVEVRLGVIVNGLADNVPVVLGSCGHPVTLCCDDGNSFCPRCEGFGDFCRVCYERKVLLATCGKCLDDFPVDELSNEMVCRACYERDLPILSGGDF